MFVFLLRDLTILCKCDIIKVWNIYKGQHFPKQEGLSMKEVKTLVISGGIDLASVAMKYDEAATEAVRNGWELYRDRMVFKDEKGCITMLQTLVKGENVTPIISLTPTP